MSQDKHSDPFESLRGKVAPDAPAAARQRAMQAGMAAFAAAQEAEKTTAQAKGYSASHRLRSIISSIKGIRIMDMRIPFGAAAIALLVVPLGYQLYSSTSMTPTEIGVPEAVDMSAPAAMPAPPIEKAPSATARPLPAIVAPAAEAGAVTQQSAAAPAGGAAPQVLQESVPQAEIAADESMAEADMAAPAMPAPSERLAPPAMDRSRLGATTGIVSDSFANSLPASVNPGRPVVASGDQFASFAEQRVKVAATDPVSTFSLDVDTASYSYVRRLIEAGDMPEPDAVRIEELINYFPYDYAPATSADVPFKPTIAVFPTPWNAKTQLLEIGIKGYVPPAEDVKPANLVFLVDTSGSMDEPDKLPLLKRAFGLLVEQLGAEDSVSIVAYAGSAGVVLEPTKASEKAKILAALDQLSAGGSTAGADGIALAYQLAEEAKVDGGTNRVILATDGDFNVGIDDPKALESFIKTKRDKGISLSVLGFGRGNLGDATMQALAQNGNGNASYISSFREAQKVLVDEIGGTLDMIAKDVKVQVEFNPALVSEYRLIGYETRTLNREDFNNDKVDAGDVGAGTSVTALYEITPVGSGAALVDPLRYGGSSETPGQDNGEIAYLKLRYKLPDSDVSQLIEQAVTPDLVYGDIADVSDDMRFAAAVAAFGQKLRGSDYGGTMGWDAIAALARSGKGADEGGYRAEFIALVRTMALLKPDGQTGGD